MGCYKPLLTDFDPSHEVPGRGDESPWLQHCLYVLISSSILRTFLMSMDSQMMFDNINKQLVQIEDSSSTYQPSPLKRHYCIMPSESRKPSYLQDYREGPCLVSLANALLVCLCCHHLCCCCWLCLLSNNNNILCSILQGSSLLI